MRQSVPVEVVSLNQLSMSDYHFCTADGRTLQFSRKQAGELLSDVDEAERQLRSYYNNADINYQIVEGIISPVPLTSSKRGKRYDTLSIRLSEGRGQVLFSYAIAENGFIHSERDHKVSASGLAAWLHRLDQAGIVTYHTANWVHTAKLLVSIYSNEQKLADEHTTLQRYIKPRIVIREHVPLVKALIGLSMAYRLDIGEKKAEAIAKHFSCVMEIAEAGVADLTKCDGIGRKIAERLIIALRGEL